MQRVARVIARMVDAAPLREDWRIHYTGAGFRLLSCRPIVSSPAMTISRRMPLRPVAPVLLVLVLLSVIQPIFGQELVVVVNPAIGIQHLTRREAIDIFLGRYRTFPTGAAALPIDLDGNSPERRQFYLRLAHKDPSDMSAYWARLNFSGRISPPFAVADAHTAVDIVAHNPNAIAYVERAAIDPRVRVALEVKPEGGTRHASDERGPPIRNTALLTSLGERFVSGYLNDASVYYALMFCAEQIKQIRAIRGEIQATGGLWEVTAIPVVFNRQAAPRAGDRCIRCGQVWVEVPGSSIGHICQLGSSYVKSSCIRKQLSAVE